MDPADVSGGQPQSRPIRQLVVVRIAKENLSQDQVATIPFTEPFAPLDEAYRKWTAVSHTFTLNPDGSAVRTVLFERQIS